MTNTLVELEDVPVEVVCLSVSPPVIRKGRVTCHGEGPCEVVLEEPEPRLEAGMRIVLDGGPDHDVRIKGMVAGREGQRLRVETERVVPPDKRSFPRMYGGIHVRYRVLAADRAEALAVTTDILLLGALVGAGLTTYFLLTSGKESGSATQVTPAFAEGYGGVNVSGGF